MTDFNPFSEAKSFDRELIPEGPHAARCVRLIEIGKQYSELYDNEQNKVVIVFSIPGVTMEINGEEKQKFISAPYGITISNSDRSSMKQYARALCPKGGASLGDFLGKPCQIYVKHVTKNDRTQDRLDSISPLLPGIQVPDLDTEPFWFQWNKPDPEIWAKIPEFTKDLARAATNYPGSYVEEIDRGSNNTDLPM